MRRFRSAGVGRVRSARSAAHRVGRFGLLALLAATVLALPAAALSRSSENSPPAAKSAKAADPAKPAKAAEPAKPAKAAKAAEPAKPAKAAEPAKPAKPAKAAKPAKPAKAAKPAKPAKPAKTPKPASSPGKSAAAQHHVIICHRTGSATNPYVVINVSIRAWQHGHQTHPALDGRVDHLLKDPATPGEKLPVSDCPGATSQPVQTPTVVPTATIVVDATSPTGVTVPSTTPVGKPLVIVVHTSPNATVTVQGAGVLGTTKTISNKRGVARISVTPQKSGVLGVKVDRHLVKRVGVLGAQTSGHQLTG